MKRTIAAIVLALTLVVTAAEVMAMTLPSFDKETCERRRKR